MALAQLPVITMNGGERVGFAAMSEVPLGALERLPILTYYKNGVADPAAGGRRDADLEEAACLVYTLGQVVWDQAIPQEVQTVLDVAVILIATCGWWGETGDVVHFNEAATKGLHAGAYAADPGNASAAARYNRAAPLVVDPSIVGLACMIIASTKVSWWQCNHHVGTTPGDRPTYVEKVAKKVYERSPGAQVTEEMFGAMHRVGHFCCTQRILYHMEPSWYQLIHYVNDPRFAHGRTRIKRFPVAAEDTRMRLESYPAGIAKVGVCVAGVQRMLKSAYALALTGSLAQQVGDLATMVRDITMRRTTGAQNATATPPYDQHTDQSTTYLPRYHMGAHYLLERRGRVTPHLAVDHSSMEGLLAAVSYFIKTTMRTSTLARAKVLLDDSEARSLEPDACGVIQQIYASLALSTAGSSVLKAMAGLQSGGVINFGAVNIDALLTGGMDTAAFNTRAEARAVQSVQKIIGNPSSSMAEVLEALDFADKGSLTLDSNDFADPSWLQAAQAKTNITIV